jgi:hypothetical protein
MDRFVNKFKKGFFFLLFGVMSTSAIRAQELNKDVVARLVGAKEFTFKATSMLPSGAGVKQLTSDYDVRLLGDSVISYLPYFGRSYTPVVNGEEGINFTSSEFEYKAKAKKKSGWQISVKPKDTREVRELVFDISDNGYAHLQVISNSKQTISYNGYIVERK